jgi:hypothetical protein
MGLIPLAAVPPETRGFYAKRRWNVNRSAETDF